MFRRESRESHGDMMDYRILSFVCVLGLWDHLSGVSHAADWDDWNADRAPGCQSTT